MVTVEVEALIGMCHFPVYPCFDGTISLKPSSVSKKARTHSISVSHVLDAGISLVPSYSHFQSMFSGLMEFRYSVNSSEYSSMHGLKIYSRSSMTSRSSLGRVNLLKKGHSFAWLVSEKLS